MAEEQKWQEAGGHTLCANNCGFFGSPTTHNFCSKCYKDLCLKEQHLSQAKLAVEASFSHPDSSSSAAVAAAAAASLSVSSGPLIPRPEAAATAVAEAAPADLATVSPPSEAAKPNRCATCRRRVGLTGFTCRCGTTFCGTHRYPDQHGCTFDFKTLGKEAIAKANPLIKAEKLDKI